jgi:hypothetical protein
MSARSSLLDAVPVAGTAAVADPEAVHAEFAVTRAVVVVDSSGFSCTTRDAGIVRALSQIRRLRAEAAAAFTAARRWRAEADNVFAEFDEVAAALAAAVTLRDAVAAAKLSLPDGRRFAACIGIGYGVLLDGGDEGLYGDEMNVASKLGEDTAEADEILLSRAAFEALPASPADFEACQVAMGGIEIHYMRYCVCAGGR